MQFEWVVSARFANVALLAFLQRCLKDKAFSMRKLKGCIDAGFCFVNGRPQRFSRSLVAAGDKIQLTVPEPKVHVPIQFVYEDECMLVIDKPEGCTCDERLVADLAQMGKKIELVHRLDKETTGLLICAKSSDVKSYFIGQFRSLSVHKKYLAIVDGVVKEDSGTIENYLGPIERYQGHVKWGVVHKDGHYAASSWQVLKRAQKATLLMLMPKTGKTHQLRIHTSGMGHPILGDHVYAKGFRCTYKAPRVMLHAHSLAFVHPKTGQVLECRAEPPEDFKACLQGVSCAI